MSDSPHFTLDTREAFNKRRDYIFNFKIVIKVTKQRIV